MRTSARIKFVSASRARARRFVAQARAREADETRESCVAIGHMVHLLLLRGSGITLIRRGPAVKVSPGPLFHPSPASLTAQISFLTAQRLAGAPEDPPMLRGKPFTAGRVFAALSASLEIGLVRRDVCTLAQP